MLKLAHRVQAQEPSVIMEISSQSQQLRAKGHDVISLAAGEPDFDTPQPIQKAAIKAMSEGITRYTPAPGFLALREAIAEKVTRENGFSVAANEVVATVGAKHAIFLAMQCLVEQGDSVLLPTPAWVSYGPIIELAGATVVPLPLLEEDGYRVNVDRWKNLAIPKSAKGIIVNYPNNPTGASYSHDDLVRLTGWALQRDLWVMSDEIYQDILYDGQTHTSLAALSPELKSHVITIGGTSKSYCMTGWRLGWAIAESPLIAKMAAMQSHCNSHVTSFVQMAGIAATQLPRETIQQMVNEFDKRRQYCLKAFEKFTDVLSVPRPTGAFYFFVNLSKWLSERKMTDVEFCKEFLAKHYVGVVPGSAFGAKNHVRMSYATSLTNLKNAFARLEEYLRS